MIRLQTEVDLGAESTAESAEMADKVCELDSADLANLDSANGGDSANFSAESPQNAESIEDFSTQVFKTLLSKNIPPLPLNYQTYFETLLNTKSIEFQKQISAMTESGVENDERNITFEKSIHSAFANTRDILKCTQNIYKNLIIMNDIEKKWSLDLAHNRSANHFSKETQSIQNEIDLQINQLKNLYQKCNQILENINTNTMYDQNFDTYNKRYFIYLVQNEQKMVEKFAHASTIIMMSLPLGVTRYLQNDQTTALVVMKTVAKLLLKTSRRSDIIGYIGNGIFAMLLRNCDILASKNASERLLALMQNTNVFLGRREICLDLNIGIAKLLPNRNAESTLNFAINALRKAQRENAPYNIYEEDGG
ncbi:GGDEF domain-containing protein [Helicobacter sp. 23-1044]